MVSLTDDAIEYIRQLVDMTGRPGDAGVRFSTGEETGSLLARLTDRPQSTDEVIHLSGARVFLEVEVADLLDDKTLDASLRDGNVTFVVARQHN